MVHQHGPQGVADPGAADVVDPAPGHQAMTVAHHRIGGHQHPGPGELGPPAEVHVLAPEGDGLVEPPQGLEQVPADQHAGRGQGEHVAHRVVLLLIELALGHDPGRDPEPVHLVADVLEHLGPVPVHQLRADDAGVAPQRLGHHGADRVGRQGHVVMANQQESRAVPQAQGGVGRGREPARAPAGLDHRGGGQDRAHRAGQPDAGGVDDGHGQARVVLAGQRLEGLGEPRAGGVGHDHGQHRRHRVPGPAVMGPSFAGPGAPSPGVTGPGAPSLGVPGPGVPGPGVPGPGAPSASVAGGGIASSGIGGDHDGRRLVVPMPGSRCLPGRGRLRAQSAPLPQDGAAVAKGRQASGGLGAPPLPQDGRRWVRFAPMPSFGEPR